SIAIYLVTVRTRIVQFLADIHEGFEISSLGRASGQLSDVYELGNVAFPIRAIHRYKPTVLALAPWCHKQWSRLGKSNGRLVDCQPAGINRRSPLHVIKRSGSRLLLWLIAGIFELNVKDDVRVWKSNGSHQ